jgi:hypothetical protein
MDVYEWVKLAEGSSVAIPKKFLIWRSLWNISLISEAKQVDNYGKVNDLEKMASFGKELLVSAGVK